MLEGIIMAFLFGGAVCAAVQIFIDKTMLTPARILVSLVCIGVLLYATGVYDPLFEMFGCGISVPLVGFGAAIARGVREAVDTVGAFGILTGGLTATSAGITLALLLGLIYSLIGRGRRRNIPKKRAVRRGYDG